MLIGLNEINGVSSTITKIMAHPTFKEKRVLKSLC